MRALRWERREAVSPPGKGGAPNSAAHLWPGEVHIAVGDSVLSLVREHQPNFCSVDEAQVSETPVSKGERDGRPLE